MGIRTIGFGFVTPTNVKNEYYDETYVKAYVITRYFPLSFSDELLLKEINRPRVCFTTTAMETGKAISFYLSIFLIQSSFLHLHIFLLSAVAQIKKKTLQILFSHY